MGLVSLPESTYEVVMILSDADNSRRESQSLISRDMLGLLVKTMRPGAELSSQDRSFGQTEGAEKNEAILAGLTYEPGRGFIKPDHDAQASVPLRFGKKKAASQAAGGISDTSNGSVALPLSAKRKSTDAVPALPAGVGFDDGTTNGTADDSDDDLIDEDELMAGEDLSRPINVPAECKPKAKRRRACKDCTCGLAARLDAEDKAKREEADKNLNTLKLQSDDLAEVDFTVQGKVGSCGNCSLGGKSSSPTAVKTLLIRARCLPMRWVSVYRSSGFQAWRRGHHTRQRDSVVIYGLRQRESIAMASIIIHVS